MPKYLIEASYTAQGDEGVRSKGGTDRQKAVVDMVKTVGGKLESFHFACSRCADREFRRRSEAADNPAAHARTGRRGGGIAQSSIARRDSKYPRGAVQHPVTAQQRRTELILSTAKIEDFDRWWNAFSTKGAEKRRQHGCKGSQVFRDPDDDHRVWVVFDWDEEGFGNFVSDPEMVAVFEQGGIQGKPQAAEFVREHDA